jgi:hypothetical protein
LARDVGKSFTAFGARNTGNSNEEERNRQDGGKGIVHGKMTELHAFYCHPGSGPGDAIQFIRVLGKLKAL